MKQTNRISQPSLNCCSSYILAVYPRVSGSSLLQAPITTPRIVSPRSHVSRTLHFHLSFLQSCSLSPIPVFFNAHTLDSQTQGGKCILVLSVFNFPVPPVVNAPRFQNPSHHPNLTKHCILQVSPDFHLKLYTHTQQVLELSSNINPWHSLLNVQSKHQKYICQRVGESPCPKLHPSLI